MRIKLWGVKILNDLTNVFQGARILDSLYRGKDQGRYLPTISYVEIEMCFFDADFFTVAVPYFGRDSMRNRFYFRISDYPAHRLGCVYPNRGSRFQSNSSIPEFYGLFPRQNQVRVLRLKRNYGLVHELFNPILFPRLRKVLHGKVAVL